MTIAYEGGIRPYRLEFVRETEEGVTPADPSWNLYSDNARTLEPTLNPNTEAQRGLGNPDPINFRTATEQHQLTVGYDLQQWFEDGSGDAQDAAYDGLVRDSNNDVPNTHTVVRKMTQDSIADGQTVDGGADSSKDTRQFYVLKGAKCNVTITGDASNPQPDLITLEYEAEKGRLYQIDQPTGDGDALAIESTDAGDTTQTVTIENDDASTTEDLDLDGTNTVTGTTDFSASSPAGIDSISLDAETAGTVKVWEYDTGGSAKQDLLMEIQGSNAYEHDEGDLGVPPLGSGSHASAIGSEYAIYHADQVERPDGTAIAQNLTSSEGTIDNAFETPERNQGGRRAIVATERTSTVETTVFGETEHYQQTKDQLTTDQTHLVWTFNQPDGTELGKLRWDSSQITEVSGTEEAGQGVKQIDLTIEGMGVTLDP